MGTISSFRLQLATSGDENLHVLTQNERDGDPEEK
jgi:hypothetical protein